MASKKPKLRGETEDPFSFLPKEMIGEIVAEGLDVSDIVALRGTSRWLRSVMRERGFPRVEPGFDRIEIDPLFDAFEVEAMAVDRESAYFLARVEGEPRLYRRELSTLGESLGWDAMQRLPLDAHNFPSSRVGRIFLAPTDRADGDRAMLFVVEALDGEHGEFGSVFRSVGGIFKYWYFDSDVGEDAIVNVYPLDEDAFLAIAKEGRALIVSSLDAWDIGNVHIESLAAIERFGDDKWGISTSVLGTNYSFEVYADETWHLSSTDELEDGDLLSEDSVSVRTDIRDIEEKSIFNRVMYENFDDLAREDDDFGYSILKAEYAYAFNRLADSIYVKILPENVGEFSYEGRTIHEFLGNYLLWGSPNIHDRRDGLEFARWVTFDDRTGKTIGRLHQFDWGPIAQTFAWKTPRFDRLLVRGWNDRLIVLRARKFLLR